MENLIKYFWVSVVSLKKRFFSFCFFVCLFVCFSFCGGVGGGGGRRGREILFGFV